MGHPETCPHGNPIDAASARRRPAGTPLSEAAPGAEITILRITEEAEEDAELLVYLEQQGLVPGVQARVTEVSAGAIPSAWKARGAAARWASGRPRSSASCPGDADPALFHRVPEAVGRLRR